MKRIARFEKVSREQFEADFLDTFGTDKQSRIPEALGGSNASETGHRRISRL